MPSTAPGGITSVALSGPIAPPAPANYSVAFTDNFASDPAGRPANGWTVQNGNWAVCSTAGIPAFCQTATGIGEVLDGSANWTDYSVDALVNDPARGTSGGEAVIGRATTPNRFYELEIRPQYNGAKPYWYLEKNRDGAWVNLAGGPLNAPDANPNYRLRLNFVGSTIAASIAFDGGTTYTPLATVTDASYASGQVGMHTWMTTSGSLESMTVSLPNPKTLTSENALAASAFIDTLGMNAHFESPVYYQNMAQVGALIGNLGIRHYRVSASNVLFPNRGYLNTLTALAGSYGLTYDVLSDLHTTPAQVVSAIGMLPAGSVDSVEGPNETDNPSQGAYFDAAFARDIPAYMQSLAAAIRANPATAHLTIVGPSFINASSYAAVGNLSGIVDAGNMHDYFGGFSPGTTGWGNAGSPFAPTLDYGAVGWNLASSAQATGTKPIEATETGYYTAPAAHGSVPFDVQAKYVPRLFLQHALQHVARTYLYQLVGYNTTTADGTLGIVSPSYAPSPAYKALAAMVGLFADPRGASAPAAFSWSLAGQTFNVDHLVVRKANGTTLIPLWVELPSYDVNANGGAGARLTVPSQTVTVTLPANPPGATLWTYDPSTGAASSTPVSFSGGSASLRVGDTVSVLVINAH